MLSGIIPTLSEELEKNQPHLRTEDLQILKEWTSKQDWLPKIEDSLLALFLHSNYFNISLTQKCIEVFYRLRYSTPEFFCDWDLNRADLQKGLKNLYFAEFGEQPNTGHKIIFHSLKENDPKEYVFRNGVTLLFMTMESIIYLNGTVPGYEMVFSCQGVKIGHLTKVNLKLLKKFCLYVQEASPLRLKAIHVLHSSSIMDKILYLLKPFVKKEILDLVHFYPGEPNERVWENLPKSILPRDFGGNLDSLDKLHDKNSKRLLRLQEIFKKSEETFMRQLEKNNTNKVKNIKKNETACEFRKLEID